MGLGFVPHTAVRRTTRLPCPSQAHGWEQVGSQSQPPSVCCNHPSRPVRHPAATTTTTASCALLLLAAASSCESRGQHTQLSLCAPVLDCPSAAPTIGGGLHQQFRREARTHELPSCSVRQCHKPTRDRPTDRKRHVVILSHRHATHLCSSSGSTSAPCLLGSTQTAPWMAQQA